MSASLHTVHRSEFTPEQAQAARIAALRFALDCHARKKTARPGGLDDAEDLDNDRTDTNIIPE